MTATVLPARVALLNPLFFTLVAAI